jgi:hypothetical protein
MKHVAKGASPIDFEDWKAKANEDWQPCYDALQNPEKRKLHGEVLQRVFDNDFVQGASTSDLERLAQAFRRPDGSGRLDGFGHVLARYAEQLLGRRV